MDNDDGLIDVESGHGEERRAPMSAAAPAPRLLDAVRERLRYMHYSLRTEEAYVYWVRGFVRASNAGTAAPGSGCTRHAP